MRGIHDAVIDDIPWCINSSTLPRCPTYPTAHCLSLTLYRKLSNCWTSHRLLQSSTNALHTLYSVRHQTKSFRILTVLITEFCAFVG
jgi:hypothetical protein